MGVIALYRRYFDLFGINKFVMRLSTQSRKARSMWTTSASGSRRRTWCAGRWTTAACPMWKCPTKLPLWPQDRRRSGAPLAASLRWRRTRWTSPCPRASDLVYTNREGARRRRSAFTAPLSTHERMGRFLIEHYAGTFPIWLAPEQVRHSITSDYNDYANQLASELAAAGVRALPPT